MRPRIVHAINPDPDASADASLVACGISIRAPLITAVHAAVTCRRCLDVMGRIKAREERRPLQPHGIKGAIGS